MAHMIEIDDELFQLLQQNAEPLVDTPSTVLRRLVGLQSSGDGASADGTPERAARTQRRGSRRRGSSGSKRAAKGTLLPEAEYELPILRYLDEHGGRAPSREVVESVGEELADKLTATDKDTLRSGDVRWKSRAAFVRLRLVERGELDGEAPRGTWAISDKGRKRARAAK